MASSPESQQRSIFISYSRQDDAFAKRVQTTLTAAGFHVWIDQTEIRPGTHDWEEAIRHAIKHSEALVLLASPHSRKSTYVKDELDLAQAYQLPVYPLWALGEIWIECIPLGRGHMEYIDARGASEQNGLRKLIETLNRLLRPASAPEPSPQRIPDEHSTPVAEASVPLQRCIEGLSL